MRWIFPNLSDEMALKAMNACLIILGIATFTLAGATIGMVIGSISTELAGIMLRADLILFAFSISMALILAELDRQQGQQE